MLTLTTKQYPENHFAIDKGSLKSYNGNRKNGLAVVTVNGHKLAPRIDLCYSPVGLEWGYNGSGPKQLA